MTAEPFDTCGGDPWGPTPENADPSAAAPSVASPELTAWQAASAAARTALQDAFAAARQSISMSADGSEPIGGPGSSCVLTNDQLDLLLQNLADYSMSATSHDLDLMEASKVLDGDAFDLFDLAHGGNVREFAHRYRQLRPVEAGAAVVASPAVVIDLNGRAQK